MISLTRLYTLPFGKFVICNLTRSPCHEITNHQLLRQITVSLFHQVTMALNSYFPSFLHHQVTISLCHYMLNIIIIVSLILAYFSSLYHYVFRSLCQHLISSLCPYVTMSLCHIVTMSQGNHVIMSLYHQVTMPLNQQVTGSLCPYVIKSQRHFPYLLQ